MGGDTVLGDLTLKGALALNSECFMAYGRHWVLKFIKQNGYHMRRAWRLKF
jgi:hypothetical protein